MVLERTDFPIRIHSSNYGFVIMLSTMRHFDFVHEFLYHFFDLQLTSTTPFPLFKRLQYSSMFSSMLTTDFNANRWVATGFFPRGAKWTKKIIISIYFNCVHFIRLMSLIVHFLNNLQY